MHVIWMDESLDKLVALCSSSRVYPINPLRNDRKKDNQIAVAGFAYLVVRTETSRKDKPSCHLWTVTIKR